MYLYLISALNLTFLFLKIKVSQLDGQPPEFVTDSVEVTVCYFTDQPLRGSSPGSTSLPNIEVISPFEGGDVILNETVKYTLDANGMVKFGIQIPDNCATATIEVIPTPPKSKYIIHKMSR